MCLAWSRMAEAPVEHVANDRGFRPGAGAVGPERDFLLQKVVGELSLGHAGLDHGIGEIGIDFKNTVHAPEVEDDIVLRDRAGIAVAPVLAAADGMEREAATGGRLHGGNHLLPVPGAQHGKRAHRPGNGRAGIAVKLGGGGQNMRRPQVPTPVRHGGLEVAAAHPGIADSSGRGRRLAFHRLFFIE